MQKANIVGTQSALDFAEAVNAGCFHLVSSIAAAGLYRGTFTEDMFEEAEGLDHPYYRTKHDSEGMVRANGRIPYRIYRPGVVVGHSQTGFIDKIDGPYYFFKALQKLRESWPRWVPLIGVEGGYIDLVPVDYVVDAMVHLAHAKGLDGRCFHLTDPKARRVGEMLNMFARAAHAPEMAFRLDPKMFAMVPDGVTQSVERSRPIQNVFNQVLRDLRVPKTVLQFINYPTRFDSTDTQKMLAKAKIRVPLLEDYAWRLWDYWERHLDPDLSIDRSLRGAVQRQGGGDHRRLVRHRRGRRDPRRRGRRQGRGSLRATRRSSPRCGRRSPDVGGFAKTYSCDITDLRRERQAREGHPEGLRPRRRAGQQRRPLHPPLAGAVVRPLPRLRAHDAAQLLRLRAPDDEPAAVDDGAQERARDQRLVDRRADQRAALLGLRGVEGRARVVRALRGVRVPRRGRALHEHQHAAGAHADDRADQDLRGDADRSSRRRRRPT